MAQQMSSLVTDVRKTRNSTSFPTNSKHNNFSIESALGALDNSMFLTSTPQDLNIGEGNSLRKKINIVIKKGPK